MEVFADLVLRNNHFTDNEGSLYTLTLIVVVLQSPASGFAAVALKEGGGSARFSPRMN